MEFIVGSPREMNYSEVSKLLVNIFCTFSSARTLSGIHLNTADNHNDDDDNDGNVRQNTKDV